MPPELDLIAAPKRLALELVGEVTRGELEAPKVRPEIKPLAEIKYIHHAYARWFAAGKSAKQIAAIMGVGPGRVRRMESDPAFQELVEYYRGQVVESWIGTQEQVAVTGRMALGEIQHRLETNPDGFSNRELKEVTEMLLDRGEAPAKTGGSQVAVAPTITFNFRPLEQVKIIEGEAA